jgi:predicted nucleic acid-binding protein
MACLDTSVLIDLSRSSSNPRHVDAKNVVQAREAFGELLFVPRPAEAEFRVGGYRLLGGIASETRSNTS